MIQKVKRNWRETVLAVLMTTVNVMLWINILFTAMPVVAMWAGAFMSGVLTYLTVDFIRDIMRG